MGSSTASALLRRRPDVEVILASRSRESYDAAIKKRPELANAPVLTRPNAFPLPLSRGHRTSRAMLPCLLLQEDMICILKYLLCTSPWRVACTVCRLPGLPHTGVAETCKRRH